jgi:serine O-acetyltransferase
LRKVLESAGLIALLKSDIQRQIYLELGIVRDVSLIDILYRFLHPRMLPLILFRCSRAAFLRKIPVLPYVFSYLNLIIFGLQITPKCEIAGGLFLPHPVGTVIGAWRIGCNATIFQQVTLGAKAADMFFTEALLPKLCDDVTIGAGAKVLGGIQLANNVVVGANSVVLESCEANTTMVGAPARPTKKRV